MRARACGLFVAMVAAMALVTASGAATAKHENAVRIDVSTRAAVAQYLRSIHVDPTGVVIQRGVRNYAGQSCPGRGWSCTTTTHPVVQVASAGGSNTFSCTTASCAVVQVSAAPTLTPNTAKCVRTTGLSQSCTISQTSSSRDNLAIVFESAPKSSGLTQTASSTASITQQATGAANSNTACVFQDISIEGSTTAVKGKPVSINLEAHQTATITQNSVGGANSASQSAVSTGGGGCAAGPLAQSQTLKSTASGSGSITQNENAANSGANMTIDVEQHSGSGMNDANFSQTNTLTAIANSSPGPIGQTQSSVNGGLLGTVNQDSSGISTATTKQTETQCEDAATSGLTSCESSDGDASEAPSSLTQIQYGPVHKGVGEATQTGNGADTFTVHQTSTQDTDQGSGSQQTNVVQGDCNTPGTCSVDQTTTVDGQTTTNTGSGQNVNTTTNCTGSTCTTGSPNVLIAGAGDFSNDPTTEPNDNLAQALVNAGYAVTESATLPADLSNFGQVWWVDTSPPTADEQNQLIAFAQSGRGVFLTGEHDFCCSDLDAADQSMVNSIVSGEEVSVGGFGAVGGNEPMPVNPNVVGNLATQPHTVTSWQTAAAGGIGGVPASSVFAYYQPDGTVVAAAWDRPDVVGNGRLALFMDINWSEAAYRGGNWSDVAENVAFFLSGLSSPPSPILLANAFPATAPIGAGTLVRHRGAFSPTGGSGAVRSAG